MRVFLVSAVVMLLFGFDTLPNQNQKEIEEVNKRLDAWHKAAAEAKFDDYFGMMSQDAIFIGTDPSENWNFNAFKVFAKPFFDKGKAWSFTAIERHVYFDASGKTAWFDELLSTQMKICRGSGVLIKEGNVWKIKHYVLSITIPNENTDEVVKIITPLEDEFMKKLSKK
jgi:hypothetical protein